MYMYVYKYMYVPVPRGIACVNLPHDSEVYVVELAELYTHTCTCTVHVH